MRDECGRYPKPGKAEPSRVLARLRQKTDQVGTFGKGPRTYVREYLVALTAIEVTAEKPLEFALAT